MTPSTQISNKENNGTQRESPIGDVEAQRKNMEQIENVYPLMVSPPDRGIADPTPLGLLSFATGVFLIGMFGINVRSIQTPNAMIGVLLFFGGASQFLAGIIEFVRGQAFGATLWCSYSAFNFSYAMIYLPGSGIMAAYTDAKTGALSTDFNQALAIYVWSWFIVNTIYAIGAIRTSWVLFLDLAFLSVGLLLLAVGYMEGSTGILKSGNAILLVVSFLSFWAGCAGFWAAVTPIAVPTFAMKRS